MTTRQDFRVQNLGRDFQCTTLLHVFQMAVTFKEQYFLNERDLFQKTNLIKTEASKGRNNLIFELFLYTVPVIKNGIHQRTVTSASKLCLFKLSLIQ